MLKSRTSSFRTECFGLKRLLGKFQFEREKIQDGKNSIRIDVVNDYQRNVVPFWKRQGFLEKENVTLAWGKKKSNAVVMKKNLQ